MNRKQWITGINRKLWIGGEWRDAVSGETMPVINPATGESLGEVPKADAADVQLAYEAAERAQRIWHGMGWKQRIRHVQAFAAALQREKDRLAYIDAVDSGNPIRGMRIDVDIALAMIRDYILLMGGLNGSTYDASHPDNLHYSRWEPYGVVGRILAYNHPLMFAATRIIPALLTGNTIVMKPSDSTPLSTLALTELFAETFPDGVINVITGGAEAGRSIVRHPHIKRIAFTGSTATGMAIQRDAAEIAVKHISLELGGKNPQIIFPDADLEQAVKYAIIGMNYGVCTGQSCGSNSRIFVHKDIHATFMDKLVEQVSKLTVGNPLEEDTKIGPLVTRAQQEKVLRYLQYGEEDGAQVVFGGQVPQEAALQSGFYVTPAIVDQVEQHMRIAREEIFGPVMSILQWDDWDEVVREANDIDLGLTASIWTKDLEMAHITANRLKAGYIWINDTNQHYPGTPFGGFKNSGTGREESIDELKSYCEQKVIHTILRR